MFLGQPYPDPPLFGQIRIFPSTRNEVRNLDFYYFFSSFLLLSLNKDVSVPSSNKQKNFEKKTCCLLASCQPLTKKTGTGG
jgi:hypothetical protein